jgi:hypothetical protein
VQKASLFIDTKYTICLFKEHNFFHLIVRDASPRKQAGDLPQVLKERKKMEARTHELSLNESGRFVVGCNYWASHAGTAMWRDWQPRVVEEDLRRLAEAGLQVLRVFPLWPDFQPIHLLRAGQGQPYEIRFGEEPLPDTEAGRAGVSEEMLGRFKHFADLADQYGLRLVVGLVTGWMSGRLFVPPALEGLNVLTDPLAIQWQSRLVRVFVRRFKGHAAILAWDLGNECNVMAEVPSRQAAWAWTAAITGAIRSADPTRPIVSGMHSLSPGRDAAWTMQDQAELTDLLTTHPYPYFTPHCDQDPANTIRTILHSTAESRFYADIGGAPCLVEEIGTLGPILASEAIAADFVRTALFSLWAHDCHGLLWWCAFDQLHLEHAPYDWAACERELGLLRKDGAPKPVLAEIGKFAQFLQGLGFGTLPARRREAVCILSEGQDSWGVAFSSFILAKQAGFDLEFQYADQPLKPANLYLMPAVRGMHAISRRRWLELLKRVEEGATLYLSHHDCLLSPFNEPFGLEVQTRERRGGIVHASLEGLEEPLLLRVCGEVRLELKPTRADVLGTAPDGNPVFTCADYGKGCLYFFALPLECELTHTPGVFHAHPTQPFWKIYRHIARPFVQDRLLDKVAPLLGITEHGLSPDQQLAVLINYSPELLRDRCRLKAGWVVDPGGVLYGVAPQQEEDELLVEIPANDAVVMRLVRHTP